jgi:hypothetical protein
MFELTVRNEEKRDFQLVLLISFLLGFLSVGLAYRGHSLADALTAVAAFFVLGPLFARWWFRF